MDRQRHAGGITAPGERDEPDVEVSDREATPEERTAFEDEMVAIVADVLVRQRTIAA